MPKLLKREKGATPAKGDDARAPDVEAEAEPDTQPEAGPEPASPPAPTASAPPAGGRRPAVAVAGGRGGLLTRMYGNPGETSRAERERQAALEFEQAVAPVMDLLAASVPEASSPEEAARAWESRLGELRPDPAGGAYVEGDRFEREARIYYRLLRRDYQKDPRPSRERGMTHHLHTQYNRFPGTKGW